MNTLSQEQVESIAGHIADGHVSGFLNLFIEHIEVQRGLLRHREVELARVVGERDAAILLARTSAMDAVTACGHLPSEAQAAAMGGWRSAIQDAIKAEQQLAAMTAERASIQAQLTTCHGIITAQETTIVIMESRLDGLAQEVSRSQLRINKLEDKLKLCTLTPERPPA